MIEYSKFFENVTGFKPYPYQIRLFDYFIKGNDILLKAPTGCGKTWGAILPFVYAFMNKMNNPKKFIYSLPLRTLANALYEQIKNNKIIQDLGLKVSLQTGEFPDDKFFEADIIFTTIDQTLSSILGFPYSLSKRQSNINPGAIIASYLIFDEFHLLDPSRSLTTSLNILKILKRLSSFCIMTATISDEAIKGINKFLDSVPLVLDNNEFEFIKILHNKKDIVVKNKEMSIEDIIREHKNKTIVICNTVERAQKLYLELKQKTDAEIICIHSRFFKKDRAEKEKKIVDIFGKKADKETHAILIATQVIEVGLDISCDTLHTEISPINSFLQRAGRCARFENEEGKIFVYDVKKNKNETKSYLPYDKELCINTMKELEKIKSLNYKVSEKIINNVLSEKESEEINNANYFDISRINRSWENSDKGLGRQLIRDINSINVILLKESDKIHSMFSYEAISLNPHTLKSKLIKINEEYDDEAPLVSVIEESNIIDDFEITDYTINEIPIDDINLYSRVVLNPKYVNYNNEIGLNFLLQGKGGTESNLIPTQGKELFGYIKETYREHIVNMIKVYEIEFKAKVSYPLSILWEKNKFKSDIDEIIKFMIIMHDYGKLNKKWQKIARDFQKSKGNYKDGELLAHTEFDPKKDRLPEGLPPHSGIGAIVSWVILEDVIKEDFEFKTIAKVVASAIIKHHSTTTHIVNPYDIEDEGLKLVLELITEFTPSFSKFDINNRAVTKWNNTENLDQYLIDFNNINEAFLYYLFVRLLRLCDQKSLEEKYVSR